jgi:hypothetical protein
MSTGEPRPGNGDAMFTLAVALFVFSPLIIVVWAVGVAVLRLTSWAWWYLALLGVVLLGLVLLVAGGPGPAISAHFAWLQRAIPALLAGRSVHLALASGLLPELPLAVPVGFLVASLNMVHRPGTELSPNYRQHTLHQQVKSHDKARRLAERTATRPAGKLGPALAISIDGDLDEWRQGRLIIPPPRMLGLPRAVLGMPSFGKSIMLERQVYLDAYNGRRVTVFDGKGSDPGFAPGIVAAYLAGWRDAGRIGEPHIGLFPQQPMDIWRGGPKAVANRLLACWQFPGIAEFYGDVAALALRLALEAPGSPVASAPELARRMIPGELRRLWAEHPDELALMKGLDARLPEVALRVANLLAALGGVMDGGWSFEDVDLAVVTVPTMAAPKDADAMLRILLVDYGHYTLARKRHGELDTLIFDEFSAISGGRQAAIHLVERARGSGSGVILAAQSRQALGPEEEAARLLHACSGGVTLFRSAEPEDVVRLAGTIRVPEYIWQLEDDKTTGRAAAAMRAQPHLDPNHVRAYVPGEAAIIEGGSVEHVRIIRTDTLQAVRLRAADIVSRAALTAPPSAAFIPSSRPPAGLWSPAGDGAPEETPA